MPLSCRKTSYTRTMRFKAFLICRPEDTQCLQVPFYLSLVWADTEPQWLTSPHLKGPFPCPLGMKYFKWSDLTNGIKTNKTNKLDSLSSLTWQKELITHLAETTNGQTIKRDSWPSLLPVWKTEPPLHHWAFLYTPCSQQCSPAWSGGLIPSVPGPALGREGSPK